VQRRGPEFISEDDGTGGVRAIVGGAEQTSEHRAEAHHLEVVAIDNAGGDLARRAEADNGEVDLGEGAELRDGLQVLADVVDLRDGKGRVLLVNAGRALPDVEKAGFVAIGKRTEQYGAHDAEDGGVAADAEGECEGDGDPERANARERANSKLQVAKKR